MLTHLAITNLALIQNIEIDLYDKFSVFTGETGAGKSVLMGAIGLLLGNRAASEHIRSGEERAEVSGSFTLEKIAPALQEILNDNAIDCDGGELIIRRIISNTSSKNRVLINGVVSPLATLKQIGDQLIDLHGQHDHQALLHEEAPYTIIDKLTAVAPQKASYTAAWEKYQQAKTALRNRQKEIDQLKEKQEFLQFQFEEIDNLKLKENEEEELNAEYTLLNSVTERAQLAGRCSNLINGSADTPGAVTSIIALKEALRDITKLDSQFAEWSKDINPMVDTLNDLAATMGSYGGSILQDASPQRLDSINSRLSKIQRLKKKYMVDYDGLLAKHKELSEELENILNGDADLSLLKKEAHEKAELLIARGKELTSVRTTAAKEFDAQITAEMEQLGFSGGGFQTALTTTEFPTPHGLEHLGFLVRANKGEPFMGLAKTASGGEISRIMLAIKSALAENDPVPILVFDEIDTGVGGTRAADIANAMKKLSAHHQIFVISHLHQIASVANHHYAVWKTEEAGRTITRIDLLSKEQRITEVARMLGGESDTTRQHAEALLEN